jgi:hypothetical protein
MVFFENNRCLKCDHPLGFLPEALELRALADIAGSQGQCRPIGEGADGRTYRNCANGTQHGVCNWLVPADDANTFCLACRLNDVIPNLNDAKNLRRWSKLELAKRRCVYTLLRLGLPVLGAPDKQIPALRFRFLEDQPNDPVKTGHENGLITINVAEADEDERERRRLQLHEPYRTLVGHFRHESGHYYWDRLIAGSPNLARFRELFGDETAAYDAALREYYRQGPPADWATRTVTPYASSHPWEDWAESWAHYLHIVETLESAAAFDLRVKDDVVHKSGPLQIKADRHLDFDQLILGWTPLVCALNAINRGMGLSDLYPFVISPPVVEKLRFIHGVVLESARR